MKNPVTVLLDALRRRKGTDAQTVTEPVDVTNKIEALIKQCGYQGVDNIPIKDLRAGFRSGSFSAAAIGRLLTEYEDWLKRIKTANESASTGLAEHETEIERLADEREAMFERRWDGTQVADFETLVKARIKEFAG